MSLVTPRSILWSAPLLLLLLATSAAAQGPIPFELGDPGESAQDVEMYLAIHDTELLGSEINVRTDDEVRAFRDQEGAGAESGSLRLLPGALGFCFLDPSNPSVGFCTSALDSQGTRPFYEIRNPPGSSSYGGIPGISTIGELIYESSCGDGCAFLEGGLESKATSGFDVPGGTLEVSAQVESPDYGVNLDPTFYSGTYYHGIEARGSAFLNDWIYVSGPPASTATVVVTASIAAEDDPPEWIVDGASDERWLTQGYGDLRLVDAFNPGTGDLLPASVYQNSSLRVALQISQWSFEEVCDPLDDEGNEICTDEWVEEVAADATTLREREILLDYELVGFDTIATFLNSDTGPLPPALTAQATVPTGRWIEVSASVAAAADCEGAKNCNLDVYTSEPVQLEITSSAGTLVSWRGIAGLTRVPEPGAAASIATALAAIGALARRRRGCAIGPELR